MMLKAIKEKYIAQLDEHETALWDSVMIADKTVFESGDPEEMAGFVLAIRAKFKGRNDLEPIVDLEALYELAERDVIECACQTLVDDDLDDFIRWIS